MKLILLSTRPLLKNVTTTNVTTNTNCIQKSKTDTQKNESKREAFQDPKEVIIVSIIHIKTQLFLYFLSEL